MERREQSIKNHIDNCKGPKYLHTYAMYESLIINVKQVLWLGLYKQSRWIIESQMTYHVSRLPFLSGGAIDSICVNAENWQVLSIYTNTHCKHCRLY